MSIISFIKKICVQPMVHWGSPIADGFGTNTYPRPIEIKVRWTEKTILKVEADGKQYNFDAEILLVDDVAVGDLVWLGALDDLDSFDPKNTTGVYEVKQIKRQPLLKSTTQFVKTAYLGKYGN